MPPNVITRSEAETRFRGARPMNHLRNFAKNVGAFFLEFGALVIAYKSIVGWIAKATIALLGLYAIANDSRLEIHSLTKTDKGESDMILAWQPTLGTATFFVAVILFIAI